ncbi:polysaccharide lyase family 8 super-sandwich domain-containing protein [Pseudoduganella lutea]|uniref:DNRLRE domain-containing protein n=1 Tax=Pseudoduganella lutea TaxID=321985 RepID=A0A4P6KY83_9BURK|nr:polysaccharide lyase family 8 super-sandwich domain-containing protein [Pseudoduganella lutea]QBE63542.1 DNRLRE domain-containing protein [Pseudoduganella lutea]
MTLFAAMHAPAVHADEFDTLRAKWQTRANGGSVNVADADVARQITADTGNAQASWNTLITSASRTSLWPDLSDWTKSSTITGSYSRLAVMAAAWASPHSSLYHNAALGTDIVAGLDWLTQNYYRAALATAYDNWWDWQIGTPLALNNAAVAVYPLLTPTQVSAYMAAIDRFVPDPTLRTSANGKLSSTAETGANRLDKALVVVLRGILAKSATKIAQGRDAISQTLPYVTSGDGFYVDGSFIQHEDIAYIGSYGPVLLSDIARLFYILNGSTWSVTDPNAGNAYAWAMEAFRPFIYDGAMMDSVRGRAIARQFGDDHRNGRAVIGSMAELAQSLPASQAAELKTVLKGWMQRDTSFGTSYFTPTPTATPGVLAGVPVYQIGLLKSILADGAIAPAEEPVGTHVFASSDRVVQREDGHAYVLSLFSNRISAFEYGNGENTRAWWTGVGMSYLYNGDLTQYTGNFWPTIDARRLPGTTTDHSGSSTLTAWASNRNTRNMVGGAELAGRYAAVAFDFATANVTGSTLTGKKAWFLFGDRIVAAGAGIASTGGANVETIVENRKLNAAGDNGLTVNGAVKSASAGWSETMGSVKWAHLASSVAGSDIGYYFPTMPSVTGLRETRTGAWSDINTTASADPVSNTFLSLALQHGTDPTAGSYSYVVLPNRSAAATAAYAAAPTVAVLERSTSAIAVADSALGLTGAVFWNDATKSVSQGGKILLTSDRKAAVVMQQTGTDLEVSVADPTQANTGVINIEINRSASALTSADAAVTVVQLSPTIKLAVSTGAAAGKSFTARFALHTVHSLPPAADAYVRDGTYATTNYGSTNSLVLKKDTSNYHRKAFVRFDLSAITGTLDSASLMLTTSSIGQSTSMTTNLLLASSASWSEATLNWTNAPAAGALLGSWTAPAAQEPVTVDVTNAVSAALQGNRQLSLVLELASSYGANGWIEYASKENGTAIFRPQLVIRTR